MGIETVTCPECGADRGIGLPRGGAIKGVRTDGPDDPLGDPRKKWREGRCPNGHDFFIFFEF